MWSTLHAAAAPILAVVDPQQQSVPGPNHSVLLQIRLHEYLPTAPSAKILFITSYLSQASFKVR